MTLDKTARLAPAAHCPILDPGVQGFLDRVTEAGLLPYGADTPAERQDIARLLQDGAAAVPATTILVPAVGGTGSVAIRIVSPPGAAGTRPPVLFYLPGGLWTLGGWTTHRAAATALAASCGAALVFVDLGPGPALPALKRARAALDWTLVHGGGRGLDTARVAIAGDGSGGALAVQLAATPPQHGCLRLQLLFHPVVGAIAQGAPASPWLAPDRCQALAAEAFPDQVPWAGLSPLELPLDRLRRLPPTVILTAEADPARDGGEALARRLMAAEVETTALRLMGTIPDFFWLDGLAETVPTLAAQAVARRALTAALHR
ncbi:alpha/beta hydrolase [Nitrospirillum iridis]|uniref:Acetyl esterase n=1 Tax=Nitrospirillum iridis TaxID=765888 RepID=A0A7X0ECV6_9PROT|nr:alpha/beta hydrolase [Nitrospirillum iridis]MBB6252073.1 acetyl esterase [Nitrospirillum iridis]